MKRIIVEPRTCVASELSTRQWEVRAQNVEIADKPMARGGQGEIYPVIGIDGQRATDLLVKIFFQGFPPSLHRTIAAVRDNNTRYGIAQCMALRGLPFLLSAARSRGNLYRVMSCGASAGNGSVTYMTMTTLLTLTCPWKTVSSCVDISTASSSFIRR